MSKTTERVPSRKKTKTPDHVLGFCDRLRITCSYAGIEGYGSLSAIARISGMTAAGVRLLFIEDRPPKFLRLFLQLVDALIGEIKKQRGVEIERNKLYHYLLSDSEWPFPEAQIYSSPSVNQGLDKFDKVYLGRVYVLLDEIAKECGVNVFKDLEHGHLTKLLDRVLALCSKQNLDLDASDSRELIKSIVLLSKVGHL
ncbi:hypothetical protein [Teredinibacter sp. KSP-S5-2]|uniref:hypothetical protein n=1 Tax=Teredinibacter sp. KSP-S5-2 TaxID=3034506 RepID=UPI0029349323|nr:hypothetical protein [Teredinibacter sp. KSP-S5-2]WNO10461.1 hypothetical protein P5V12_04680 [Teredinibacter sp. KSP-S5-2]